ncbi:MAG: DUF1592 domain-containing protein [Gemmatimonadota bacterium]|nr:DUF1592 domain-containing protein [Gemmatimonadota bacterium]
MPNLTHPVLIPIVAGAALAAAVAVSDRGPDTVIPPADWLAAALAAGGDAAVHQPPEDAYEGVVEQYCMRCHNDQRLTGNLSLESFTFDGAADQGEIAEKMIKKLRAGMMPPAGARRPEADSLQLLMVALEDRMDELARENPNPGSRTFQRLNRAEYQASVRELLGIGVDVSAFLPLDTKSANFDNIADVQMPSTTLMEGYLRAASQISREALGDVNADPGSKPYTVPRTQSQKDRVPGAPFGTRGGLAVDHNFPADGRYVFQVTLHSAPEGELFGRTQPNEQVEVSVDGERVAVLDIDRWMSDSDPNGMTLSTDSIQVRAGTHRVAAVFIKRWEGPEDDLITPVDHTLADTQIGLDYGVTTLPHLQRFAVVGPFRVTGVSETETRRRIFTCRPLAPAEARPCAQSIVERLATKAYRRPLMESDIEGLMGFYDQGFEEDGFEGGVRFALEAILASPHFVFRVEEAPSNIRPGSVYRISDYDLASRLSYFIWGTPPDAELIELARKNELSKGGQLEKQVQRLLADPRSEGLATRFAAQWLRLSDVDKVHPDALSYPYYDATLAEAMKRETELFFDYLVRQDRSALEMLSADYTFVNERLARHYGIPNVVGSDFQMARYADESRRGLLGHGSILTLTSHADRTSPVLRGKWVMEVLLGSPPPAPPPNVPALEQTEGAEEGRILTVRERMEQHRANPSCNSCHRVIDPIGLALENFDPTGAFRVKDGGNLIDPVGELYDGSAIAGPADLREAILARPEVFLRTFTENLMAYAIGRRLEYYDMPAIRAITRDAAKNDYRISAFIEGVVESDAFLTSRVEVTADEMQHQGTERN